ncbi:MAG: hypothetical protein LBU06_11430 [Desulfovibrio sp.]|jgi:hypothetical protein|nr:hypothetical protein [Desulfovibrio sp.]
MPNAPYQKYFEAQKAMFEEWRNFMKANFFKDDREADAAFFNPEEYFAKFKDAPQDFWKKAENSYKAYQAVYELWKKLSEDNKIPNSQDVLQIYDEWSKQFFTLLKDGITPAMPGYMKDFAAKFVGDMESGNATMSGYLKNWSDSAETLNSAFRDSMQKGPKGYIDFLNVWQENYEKSFGTLLNSPTYGKEMEFWRLLKASLDRFIKYDIAARKFSSRLAEIMQDATKRALEDYVDMHAKGTQPKTFEEFYKYWVRLVSDSYQKVLSSDDVSILAGNMVDAMSKFKIEFDKLCEVYLSVLPIPKNSDMDALYKTVYELKKELRALKQEVKANEKRNA